MTDKERADKLAADLETLKAENATMKAEKDDHDRRDAIMALEEAKGREAQAKLLADNGVAVESAKAILAAAPAPSDQEEDTSKNYERTRLDGAGMNRGANHPDKKGDKSILSAAIARTNKRR